MKNLLLIFSLFIILAPAAQAAKKKAKSNSTFSEKLQSRGYYYSALNEFFQETYDKPVRRKELDRLEKLLFFTGIEILEDYDPQLLEKYPTSSTYFILGRRANFEKKFQKALELFGKVNPGHRYYPEAQLLMAQVYSAENNGKKEFEYYNSCQESAEKEEGKTKSVKIKRYYRMIFEICLINKARRFYKEGKFNESLEAYNKVPKTSYKWPYVLLEKAWIYYQLGDFNRAIGLLLTYKSPLLDTYFFPEAEYLAALSYYRLCLYDDSSTIINQYYNFYRPKFVALEKVLRQSRNSQNYFYDLMFKPGEDLKKHEQFVHQIITRLKKQTRFSLDFNSIFKIEKEMRKIATKEKKPIQKRLMGHLAEVKENMVNKINYNAKNDIFQFLQQVPFFSSELFKIDLEIISRKKDLLYGNKKLVADRSRGDYSNVKRTRFEQFWKFEGAFWADELGDYSLGLQSNCQTVSRAKGK